MAMNVQIISIETVKPSSPTPHENRTYRLSLMDQITPPSYTNLVLFYSKPKTSMSNSELNDHLKASLSKTLTHFYPFAGRVKDEFCIDCNDHGVSYVQAHVDVGMSTILEHPRIDVLAQLVPTFPNENSTDIREKLFLGFQVNEFACGGIALGVKFFHVIADASSIGSFIKSWAAIAHGDTHRILEDGPVVVDCTSLFPPAIDARPIMSDFFLNQLKNLPTMKSKSTIKRLVFKGPQVAALKEKIGNEHCFMERPISRVQSLYTLIWDAVIRIVKEQIDLSNSNGEVHCHSAACIVNIRKRFNPPLPTNCIGNLTLCSVAQCPLNETIDYNLLAGKISQSIKMINNDFLHDYRNQVLNYYLKVVEQHLSKGPEKNFVFNSVCNFPFYESDFGFGKPAWFVPILAAENAALLFDAPDGEGIEAWIVLPVEYMVKFERDPAILEYAQFDN